MDTFSRQWLVVGAIIALVVGIGLFATTSNSDIFLKASVPPSSDDPATPSDVIDCNNKRKECNNNARDGRDQCDSIAYDALLACLERIPDDLDEETRNTAVQSCNKAYKDRIVECSEQHANTTTKCASDFCACVGFPHEDDEEDDGPLFDTP